MDYKKEWFNDTDFWSIYAPVIFDDKRWAEVPEVVDSVIRHAGLSLYGGIGACVKKPEPSHKTQG
ncbi:MAG: hypothetical protein FWF29_10880, partial [Treponema sp.]|nr:hypothetical protein [Treponema sp.]